MIGCLLLNEPNLRITRFACLEGNLRQEDGDFSNEISGMDFETFEKTYFPKLIKRLSQGQQTNEQIRLSALRKAPAFVIFKSANSIAVHANQGKILEAFKHSNVNRVLIRGSLSHFGALPTDIKCSEYVIPQSGHFMLIDNPSETFRAIATLFEARI
jgi:hypothetical protein